MSQREAEYEPETVYEVAGAADHYQAGLCLTAKPLDRDYFLVQELNEQLC